jgi:hypothetical protein
MSEPATPERKAPSEDRAGRRRPGHDPSRPREAEPYQRGLREALLREFKARKVKKFVEKQVKYINANRQVAEEIKILFDENGQPPANAPMEDIIAERRQLEYQIKWFEAMVLELQTRLLRVREIEALALDVLEHSPEA